MTMTLKEAKTKLLEAYMYNAFSKPGDAIYDVAEDHKHTKDISIIDKAHKELLENNEQGEDTYSRFEFQCHDLINNLSD